MSSETNLSRIIDDAWDERETLSPSSTAVRESVQEVLDGLDTGRYRVAEKRDNAWHTHQWVKKAILLFFRLNESVLISGGPDGASWWDKIPPKFKKWGAQEFSKHNIRTVPDCVVRHAAYIGPKVILMPSFVNIGAYIDEGSMIDSWVTIGSCAQIGRNCHVSSHVMIGGVLEPIQANPTIIEDHCFIGAGSALAEGIVVEEGCVLSMGVSISASTKIVDRSTGEICMGRVPAFSVVVPGNLPSRPLPNGQPGPSLACAVIVKRVDRHTREKTSVNELLRD
jgi:2,3,4,5-tetrahydropyridine-2,6-dicarboxylate N-succinyltransferase